jgi:hypothetical protein
MLDGPTLQSARGFFKLKGSEFFLVFFPGNIKVENITEQYVSKGKEKKRLVFTLMKSPYP